MFKINSQSFGLDISDKFLRIIKLAKKGDNLMLKSFGKTKIPTGIVKEGEIKEPQKLAIIIKQAIKEINGEKIKTKYVTLSLPEEKSFLDVLKVPILGEEEIERTIKFEIENYIPLEIEEVYFDFQKIKTKDKQKKYQEVLIAAAPKKIVNPYLETLEEAGLRPLALEIECLSTVRALVKKNVGIDPLLIIDIGEEKTSFIIFSEGSLRFTSTIPISSETLTVAISKNLKIKLDKAELLKSKEGLIGKKEVFEAMIPCLTDLIEQIKNCLAYYLSRSVKTKKSKFSKKLEKILICGSGANLKGLVNFLSSSLKIEVEIGNPWINILEEKIKEVPKLPFKKSLGYTTALGLALKEYYD